MKLKIDGFYIIIESNFLYGDITLTSITPGNTDTYTITPTTNTISKNGISISQTIYDVKSYMDSIPINYFPVCNITTITGLSLADYITRLPIILPSYHLYDIKYYESKLYMWVIYKIYEELILYEILFSFSRSSIF